MQGIQKAKKEIKGRLGIPFDKKVILYAPTFREFERDEKNYDRNIVIDAHMEEIKKIMEEKKNELV